MKPKLIVFASGRGGGGGSGFENLVEASRSGILDAEVVGVVSSQEDGDIKKRAETLGIRFSYFAGPYDAEHYFGILQMLGIKQDDAWFALSGWLKKVEGLNPKRTFNIHPALLSQLGGRFGGHAMYGRRVHDAVKAALDAGEITESGFSMHFVTDEMDKGPIFFEYRVPLKRAMSAEEIEKAVRAAEHEWQPKITNLVIHGKISWDGKDPSSLVVPANFK